MRRNLIRSIGAVALCFAVLFGLELGLEIWRLGIPTLAQVSWADVNNPKFVDLLSPFARAYNNILAMLLATIGLAIPLTANTYTPKLIDMFFRDPVNRVVLVFAALGAANVLAVAAMIGPGFVPVWAVRVAIVGAIAGWIICIPYFFYIVRFLDPTNIIAAIENEARAAIDERKREVVHERMFQLGTTVLKSLERADRTVALDGIRALERLTAHHGTRKRSMPLEWFRVDERDFAGLSSDALEIINNDRTWFESAALHQLLLCYRQALTKSCDSVSPLGQAVRSIALSAMRRNDDVVVELCVKLLNNFLHESIRKRDGQAFNDLLCQYRLLANALVDRPAILRQVGRYFHFYADAARDRGLRFEAELAAFDLAHVVRCVWNSPAAGDLFDEVLRFANTPLVVKAKLILGAFFVERGLIGEAVRVRQDLKDVPPDALREAEEDLLRSERAFFEISDRQENLDYLRPERRRHLRSFVELERSSPPRSDGSTREQPAL